MIGHASPSLASLFPAADLAAAIGAGHVREQTHPTLPLRILNYTEKAAADGVWTPVTLACRGLIVGADDTIVARPFGKFFNYGQVGAATIELNAKVAVIDKLDGSLGIAYPLGDGLCAVATRGSFASEQATHATELLYIRYAGWRPLPGWTALFEIVYPTNRIVCDYGDLDDLVFLGAVEIQTGAIAGPEVAPVMRWPGPVAEVFPARSLAEALAMPPRPNAEGVVVRCVETGAMVKLKQADYIALHRIVTGLNARSVWQRLADGRPIDELIEPLPDEFHSWVREVAAGITTAVADEHRRLFQRYQAALEHMPDDWGSTRDRAGRATFAQLVTSSDWRDDSWAMFGFLDGRDITPDLLKRARPEPFVTPSGRIFTEATA